MSRLARRPVPLLAVASLVVLVGLLLAGTATIPVRTFALGVPDSGPAGLARPSHRVCEGPVQSPTAFHGVGVFADPAAGSPTVEVSVIAGGHSIASGSRAPNPGGREQIVWLDRAIPAGRAVSVCIRTSSGALTIWGAGAQVPGLAAHGVTAGQQFALVLTRHGTLLGSLSTAFSRAAIFRPSWVGEWTFWLLLALLAGTLPLAALALTRAIGEDEADES